jgi:hypothetical protein
MGCSISAVVDLVERKKGGSLNEGAAARAEYRTLDDCHCHCHCYHAYTVIADIPVFDVGSLAAVWVYMRSNNQLQK